MTIQDIIDFLVDEAHQQTLTRKKVERCILLVYELGLRDAHRPTQERTAMEESPWSAEDLP